MRRFALIALTLGLAAPPILAGPLVLGYGPVSQASAEPAATGESPVDLSTVAEHVEFLLAHEYRITGLEGLGDDSATQTAVLTFDDPESFAELVLPLVEIWRIPVVVTVPAIRDRAPESETRLRALAESPWVELVARIDSFPPAAGEHGPHCSAGSVATVEKAEEQNLSELAARLGATMESLAGLSSDEISPAVVWGPGAYYGPAESVARGLGLRIQLTTYERGENLGNPVSDVYSRYRVAPGDGVWALVQAAVPWDPDARPVRFVEVDGDWICEGGDFTAGRDRLASMVRRLGLNAVRLDPVQGDTAWFPTRQLVNGGFVAGPLAAAMREVGTVDWILVDFPSVGESSRDVSLAADLARAVDLDVAILPRRPWSARMRDAVLSARPTARIAWLDPEDPARFDFDWVPRSAVGFGRTVTGGDATVDARLLEASAEGVAWLGLAAEALDAMASRGRIPVEMALPADRVSSEPRVPVEGSAPPPGERDPEGGEP